MTANLWNSAGTFKRCTAEKASFVLLNLFDLTLTVLAISLGILEINPLIRYLVNVPILLLIVKLAVPLLIAWLVPGKILLPSIALLVVIAIWNVKELLFFLF